MKLSFNNILLTIVIVLVIVVMLNLIGTAIYLFVYGQSSGPTKIVLPNKYPPIIYVSSANRNSTMVNNAYVVFDQPDPSSQIAGPVSMNTGSTNFTLKAGWSYAIEIALTGISAVITGTIVLFNLVNITTGAVVQVFPKIFNGSTIFNIDLTPAVDTTYAVQIIVSSAYVGGTPFVIVPSNSSVNVAEANLIIVQQDL